ncbi:MAG: class I SAM-dependent methyltransferase [Thermodesulfobacteriaceae bacterium]|nr:class I SAM-dependent methyltransferase [Thermodesulfobacteriaceae bacterium]MCX8041456.1 class I SAM-dependent methyltransferase [Thermodesulfobacteriaceae bacterium]MDW8135761.1 class I SAM-dependent methyltransferase [Thermodesulfobacterium sp.]
MENFKKSGLPETADYYSSMYRAKICRRFLSPGRCLELGPAWGNMTIHLVDYFKEMVCVEGSSIMCEYLRQKLPQVKVIQCLFEEFDTNEKFDAIILAHVLEHVDEPVKILKKVKKWLKKNGKIFASCPNARSLHRQLGVILGILKNEGDLNETDLKIGHKRVYTPESFRGDFIEAELKIEYFGGYWIKIHPNREIENFYSEEMLKACMVLGERYPDIAAEIYIIASL